MTPDSVHFDIGAWIGPTVLFAARRCRQVYCFEPDRIAFQHLIRNLLLNRMRHVQPFNLALSDRDGMLTMGAGMNGKLGKSTTSALRVTSPKTIRVLALSWKSWLAIAAPEKPDLIKIDIEGGEFALLPAMADYLASTKPALLVSTHAFLLEADARRNAMQNLARILSFYGTCRDEQQVPISLDAFVSPESLNRPRSFLLTP